LRLVLVLVLSLESALAERKVLKGFTTCTFCPIDQNLHQFDVMAFLYKQSAFISQFIAG